MGYENGTKLEGIQLQPRYDVKRIIGKRIPAGNIVLPDLTTV